MGKLKCLFHRHKNMRFIRLVSLVLLVFVISGCGVPYRNRTGKLFLIQGKGNRIADEYSRHPVVCVPTAIGYYPVNIVLRVGSTVAGAIAYPLYVISWTIAGRFFNDPSPKEILDPNHPRSFWRSVANFGNMYGGVAGQITGSLFIPLAHLFDEDPCYFGTDTPSENQEEEPLEGTSGLEDS